MPKDRDAPIPVDDRTGYWDKLLCYPKVLVIIASTNEPQLEQCLLALQAQSMGDFLALVVVDHADSASWEIGRGFVDDRFHFMFSPSMQGLARVWNIGITSDLGDYLLITGGECVLPPNFLQVGLDVLRLHPEYVMVPTADFNHQDMIYRWNYMMTRACAKTVGPFSYTYGPGGTGTVGEWFYRAKEGGYRVCQVMDLLIPHLPYSIQDKALGRPDWDIEGKDQSALLGFTNDFHPGHEIIQATHCALTPPSIRPSIWDRVRGSLVRQGE